MIPLWFAAVLGLLVGSFLNVCILRLPWDYSVAVPRSHCYGCGAFLSWFENIPVLSWLALGGRCRRCRAAISIRYPLVELVTAAGFFYIVRQAGWSWGALRGCLLLSILLVLILCDFDWHILPDEFTLGPLPIGLTLAAIEPLPMPLLGAFFPELAPRLASFLDAAAGAALMAAALGVVGALYQQVRDREGLGFGDVKMMAMVAAFLGLMTALQVLMIGSIAGSLIGFVWLKLRGKDLSTEPLPFGSFLGAAALVVTLLSL
jgi:leader peptidase (prepilin peptidase) / N-methyltransferase